MAIDTGLSLLVLSVGILVATNVALMASGWLDDFEKLPPLTGVYVLDLLIAFFKDILSSKHGALIFESLGTFAVPATTLVLYEGSR